MAKFIRVAELGRDVRADELAVLSTPTLDLVRVAIDAGDVEEAERLLDYWWDENTAWIELYPAIHSCVYSWVAEIWGEEHLPDFITHQRNIARAGEDNTGQVLNARLSPEERQLYRAETKRSQHYTFRIWEEPDRYVMQFLPSNTAGRMMAVEKARGEPLPYLGRTKRAWDWSFDQANVPYYCVHCAIGPKLVAGAGVSAPLVFEFEEMGNCKQYIAKE